MRMSVALSFCLALTAAGLSFADPGALADNPQLIPVPAAVPSDRQEKIAHLATAIEHLQAAGMGALAARVTAQLRLEQRALHQDKLARKIAELQDLQQEVDRLRKLAGSPAQVHIGVRMIEVDRRKLPLTEQDQRLPVAPPFDGIENLAALNARIKDLLQQRVIKVLAEPELIAASGMAATFVSGGEFPIPIPAPGGTIPASAEDATVQMKPYGVLVEALPRTLGGDRLSVEISIEVSNLDTSRKVTIAGQSVPGLTARRINTRVDLEAGRPCVLGGMKTHGPDGEQELVVILVADAARE